jgi:2-iminoacetate synthase
LASVTTNAVPALTSFADWILTTDEHAAHHLRLAQNVDRALDNLDHITFQDRVSLSQKLERWRYQHLNEHAPGLSLDAEAFVDALDLAANELAGRPDRPPRRTRHAIHDGSLDNNAISEAMGALDPQMPLQRLVQQATRLTQEHFSVPEPDRGPDAARRRVLLYAPLYVSSHCVNYCT